MATKAKKAPKPKSLRREDHRNPTQWVEALMSEKAWGEVDKLLDQGPAEAKLTIFAHQALARELVHKSRFEQIGKAYAKGWGSIFEAWAERGAFGGSGISEAIDWRGAQKALAKGPSKRLVELVDIDMANRVGQGDWEVWESRKGDAKFRERLLGEPGSRGARDASCLLLRLFELDGAPPDLLEAAKKAAAADAWHWSASRWDPKITEWGTISRNESDPHPVHGLIWRGEWRSAMKALDFMPVEEYGQSGQGPIDSALLAQSWEAVEALRKQDPMVLFRPVRSAREFGGGNWKIQRRVPLEGFLHAMSAGKNLHENYAFRSRPEGEAFAVEVSFVEATGKWMREAALGSGDAALAERVERRMGWLGLAEASGKFNAMAAMDALAREIESFVADAGLAERLAPSYRAFAKTEAFSTGKNVFGHSDPRDGWSKTWRAERDAEISAALVRALGFDPLSDERPLPAQASAASTSDIKDKLQARREQAQSRFDDMLSRLDRPAKRSADPN